jgi:hypothetical protein
LASDSEKLKVGIIGGGHLGKQLVYSLLQLVPVPANNLRISTRRPEALGEEQYVLVRGSVVLVRCQSCFERVLLKRNSCVTYAEFLY